MSSFWRTKWNSCEQYAQGLVADVSCRRNVRFLIVVILVALLCFAMLWGVGLGIGAATSKNGGGHVLSLHEYVFSVIGAIDADPNSAPMYAFYSAVVRLVGAIVIGGVLTSFLCSLLFRFSDMTLKGLLVPALRDHIVIVGYTSLTDDLVRMLLSDRARNSFDAWYPYRQERADAPASKILLYTSGDVQSIRDTLNSVLDRDMERRVVYAFGDMDMSHPKMAAEICQKLSIHHARAVIILGDACDPYRGDLKNLAFASVAGGSVRKQRIAEHAKIVEGMSASERERLRYDSSAIPVPFYVQMEDVPTFDLLKRMEYKIGSKCLKDNVDLGTVGVYIRPFSYYEGWARAIWGAPYVSERYFPLDFRPMDEDSYVHLIVAGLSKAGEALVIEAIRICHYPHGKPTVITVVDSNPDVETNFRVHHAEVFNLDDISIEFKCARLQSDPVRKFIAGRAKDQNCLLTVAICFRNIEATMFEGLCLPPEVYHAYEPEGVPGHVKKRQDYPKHPPRILVYQEHVNGDPEVGESVLPVRYKFVRPFGMQEQGLQTRCMRSFASMYLNAVFFWPLDADGKSFVEPILESGLLSGSAGLKNRFEAFAERWKTSLDAGKQSEIPAKERYDLLKDILSLNDTVLEYFKKYAFRRFVMMEPVKEWGNMYVPDFYGTLLRAVGLTAAKLEKFNSESANDFAKLCKRNDDAFTEARSKLKLKKSLEEVEHLRWIADRALMGYRPARQEENEERDDGYRYHKAMRPHPELSDIDKNKDALVVMFIPLFMALEGLEIKKLD